MENIPNLASVTPVKLYPPTLQYEYEFDAKLLAYASQYLEGFAWNDGISETYIGYVLREKLGVFLFKINKSRKSADEWVWVIVGDIPPAYITTDQCKTPSEAIDGYIGAMDEWVEAAFKGQNVENLIPVNVEPKIENAKRLQSRLKFIDEAILPKIEFLEKQSINSCLH